MRLYKDYKEKQQQIQKEEEDRNKMGLSKETVIIYEKSHFEEVGTSALSIAKLIFIMAVIGMGIMAVTMVTMS